MKYNIRWMNEDGGGIVASGFASVEEAREWWSLNGDASQYDSGDTIAIYEEDGERYGEKVEDLN